MVGGGSTTVTASLMTLHVASDAKGLAAPDMRAAEGFLTRVAVGVDSETGRAREGLVAYATDISVVVERV